MNKTQLARQQEIERLSTLVEEKAQLRRGGSACLVPSSDNTCKYRVDVDKDYNVIACECRGGKGNCKHKLACELYFAPKLQALKNSTLNPVYQFERNGKLIEARLSQFSKAEKAELREQQRLEEEARQRALHNTLNDPNYLNSAA